MWVVSEGYKPTEQGFYRMSWEGVSTVDVDQIAAPGGKSKGPGKA